MMLLNTTTSVAANDVRLDPGDCVGDVMIGLYPKDYLTMTNEIKACDAQKANYVELKIENAILAKDNQCPSCAWGMAKSSVMAFIIGLGFGMLAKR